MWNTTDSLTESLVFRGPLVSSHTASTGNYWLGPLGNA